MHLVWFKRDLRIADHRPLAAACRDGCPVLCLYVYEPDLWRQPDADSRHLNFINRSLEELRLNLNDRGGRLIVRVGEMPDVLEQIQQHFPFSTLHSHEETGTLWTYARDRRVAAWCRNRGVKWIEQTQNGVIRRLPSRDGWARRWQQRMNERLLKAPREIYAATGFAETPLVTAKELGLATTAKPESLQEGGESSAHGLLKSFLRERGRNYHRELSSPVTAWDSCSRLSSHLAWGTISMPQLYQTVQQRIRTLRRSRLTEENNANGWLTALKAYTERLHWHCHFIQKLEDQPNLEEVNLHRACDGLRPLTADSDRLQSWVEGRTGYPLVDACMRQVMKTGWLNFRMRALVVSFASYHLWLDWRHISRCLARMFTDYEPGIHYNQMQMQAGTTGISSIRIYNPIRQVAEQDPDGSFIREWVPELADVPAEYLAEPHRMSLSLQSRTGCLIGTTYPGPIVDQARARAAAVARMQSVRCTEAARRDARSVFLKHGSRRGGMQQR